MPEDKKKEIQKLLNALDPDRLSKEDFVNAFEQAVNLIFQIQKEQGEAIDRLEETYRNLLAKVRSDHTTSLSDLKGQVNDLFVGDQLKRIDGESKASTSEIKRMLSGMIDVKLREVDGRMAKVKDGYTPIKGKDYFDGIHGKDGKGIDEAELKKLLDDIETLKRRPVGKMGMRKIPITRWQYLTSQVNGSTTEFTLDRDTVRVHGILSSQFPGTLNTTDWVHSGNTLTVGGTSGGGVGVIQAGQTLVAVTEVLFYA